MKKIFSLIIIILALSVGFKAQAQAGVGATYIGDYTRMSSRSAMDKDMENGNWAYRMKNLNGGEYNLIVTLKNGSVKRGRSKIYADSIQNKSFVLIASTDNPAAVQKIYTDETANISCATAAGNISGMPTDSCWLFLAAKGKISAYTFFPKADGPFSLVATQVGNGPIQYFDLQAIKNIVKDNKKAYKAFRKRDYLKAIMRFNSWQ